MKLLIEFEDEEERMRFGASTPAIVRLAAKARLSAIRFTAPSLATEPSMLFDMLGKKVMTIELRIIELMPVSDVITVVNAKQRGKKTRAGGPRKQLPAVRGGKEAR